MFTTYGLTATGIVIILFGVLFHLQGQGIVGPEQSFMYRSADWQWYGIAIGAFGGILASLSIVRILRRRGLKPS